MTQTEVQPLAESERVGSDPQHHLTKIKDQVAERGIKLVYDDLPPGADGVSRGERISIRSGLEPANEFSVIVHELAHELLHRGNHRPNSKTVRQTEAEAVAFVICRTVGLETGSDASNDSQLYDSKTGTLAVSPDRIQQVAADIIAAIQCPNEQAVAA